MGKFQRRHYEIIAETFVKFNEHDYYSYDDILEIFITMLQQDNQKFKEETFVNRIQHLKDRFAPRYD
jgi:hypothetical protein